MEQFRNAYRVRHEGKRPLGRPKCRWEHNIIMDLKEMVCDSENWIDTAHVRMNGGRT